MALSSEIVDAKIGSRTHGIDQRRLMAFAAAVGDARPEHIDTARPGGIVPHPLFPLSLEWRSFLDVAHMLVELGMGWDEVVLAEPLDYDLMWLGSLHPGDTLSTHVRVIAVQAGTGGGKGATVTMMVDTENDHGEPVSMSMARVMFPETELDGLPVIDAGLDDIPALIIGEVDLRSEWSNPDAVIRRGHRRVGAAAAHVFSECSGMWNPIFTDKAAALEHGRAYLALPHAAVLAMSVGGALQLGSADPGWVRRVRAVFGSLVPVPSVLEIEAEVPRRLSTSQPVRFRSHLVDGTPVITSGVLVAEPGDVDLDLVAKRARAERRQAMQQAQAAMGRVPSPFADHRSGVADRRAARHTGDR